MKKVRENIPARDVDDYLAALPEDSRATLKRLRNTIKAAAPKFVREDQLPDAHVQLPRNARWFCRFQKPLQSIHRSIRS